MLHCSTVHIQILEWALYRLHCLLEAGEILGQEQIWVSQPSFGVSKQIWLSVFGTQWLNAEAVSGAMSKKFESLKSRMRCHNEQTFVGFGGDFLYF